MTTRVHIGIPVRDVEKSLPFYETLFGIAPVKVKPGYAKFSVADPPVNFSLNRTDGAVGPTSETQHYGIEVGSTVEIDSTVTRFADTGVSALREDDVTCCYSRQDRAWFADPDGNRWEVFVVHEDVENHSSPKPCCEPTCCT